MISHDKANEILNVLCGRIDNMPTTSSVYIGLCADEPAADDGKVTGEPEIKSYSRKKIGGAVRYDSDGKVIDDPDRYFTLASDGVIYNEDEIMFSTAREDYGKTMYYWFLSSSSGKGTSAYLWGKVNRTLEDGTKEWGLVVKKDTVPVFYEKELVASIDTEPIIPTTD